MRFIINYFYDNATCCAVKSQVNIVVRIDITSTFDLEKGLYMYMGVSKKVLAFDQQ